MLRPLESASLDVLAWNCGGFSAEKANYLSLARAGLPTQPAVVVLLELHQHLAETVLPGYHFSCNGQNSAVWLATWEGTSLG